MTVGGTAERREIRALTDADFAAALAIINEAAEAKG